MHSFEFMREAEAALESIEQFSEFIEANKEIANALGSLPLHLSKISGGSQASFLSVGPEIKSSIDAVRPIVRSLSPRQIFKDIESLSALLEKLDDKKLENFGAIKRTNSDLQKFSSDYESYITNYDPAKAVSLAFSSGQLASSLESLIGTYKFCVANLKDDDGLKDSESHSELSLYLSNIKDLRDFAGKLNAIADLYEDIAALLGVNVIDYPLIIDQVESGSLWSKVSGETSVISLMVDMLKGGAGFLYRNLTTEGKISSIPSKLESLDKIIDLTGRLEQAGVDTKEIHDEVRRATVSIAKNLNMLLDSQSKIEVNGESHSVADELLKGLTGDSWLRPRLAHEDKKEPPLSLPPSE